MTASHAQKASRSSRSPAFIYKRVVVSFISLAVLLILVIIYFSVVSLEISVSLQKQPVSMNTLIKVREMSERTEALPEKESAKNTALASKEEIAGEFFEKPLSFSLSKETSGKTRLAQKETFIVFLKNESSMSQPLVKTTRLLSENKILLRLAQGVQVPAKGSLSAEVYPDESSLPFFEEGGSLPAQTRFSIPGLAESKQKVIYGMAETVLSFLGKEVAVVSQTDVDTLRKKLLTEVEKEKSALRSSQFDVLVFSSQEEENFVSDKKVGEVAAEVTVSLELSIVGVKVKRDDLFNEISARLSSSLDEKQELAFIEKESFSAALENIDAKERIATLRVSLSGEAKPKFLNEILDKKKIAGMSRGELSQYFDQFAELQRIEIKFFPFWVRKASMQLDHISIKVE